MAGQVYFGNANYQTWIPAPQSPMEAGSVGYSSETTFLNGRGFVKRSRASHRVFSPTWFGRQNDNTLTGLNTIKDFQDGVYGDGPFYWVDPFADDTNILPPHWAVPALAEKDWPALDSVSAPTFTAATYANGYPYKYASYSMAASQVGTKKLTIIIPSGYTLSFGWHHPAANTSAIAGPGVRITPYLRSTGAATTVQNPTSLIAGGTARVSTVTTAGSMSQFDGATYSKIDIYLANGGATTLTATIVAMAAQLLPTGTAPSTGNFISGRGTTALEFSSFSSIQYYSSGIDGGQIGLSVNLTEVDK
jgi:hypothetical protein